MVDRVYPVAAVTGAPSYDGRALRQTAVAPFVVGATAARPLGARSGVRPGTPATTVSATSTTWTVNAHVGVIDAESANEAGPYVYSFDAVKTGSMTAADATNPRIDVIYVRIDDPAESDGSSVPVAAVGYQAGTPAPSPSAPTVWTGSARSMVIAQINVPKSGAGSPSVTWLAPYATAPGGIIPVRTQAERDAITFATADFPVYVDRKDTSVLERNAGSGWKRVQETRSQQWGVGGFLDDARQLMFNGTITTDASGVSQAFDVHTVIGTVLSASFMAVGSTQGAGVAATLYDSTATGVKFRIWVGSTPQTSASFAGSFVIFGRA